MAAEELLEKRFKVSFPEIKLGLTLQDEGADHLPVVSGLPYGHPQIQVRYTYFNFLSIE